MSLDNRQQPTCTMMQRSLERSNMDPDEICSIMEKFQFTAAIVLSIRQIHANQGAGLAQKNIKSN
jgi:hypothetical protein